MAEQAAAMQSPRVSSPRSPGVTSVASHASHSESGRSGRPSASTPVMQRLGWRGNNRNSSNHSLPKDVQQLLHAKSNTGVSQVSSGRTSATETGTLEQILDIKRLIEEKERQIREAALAEEEQESVGEEAEVKAEKQLVECINEFIATEANYLEDLRFTTREYARPLAEMLDQQAHYKIFSNHEQLLELHQKLDQALIKAKEKTGVQRSEEVVSAFLALLPYFKMYAAYCANYPHVAAALGNARSEDKVARLLADKHSEHQTTLQALLFRPVQRMCLYPLLFKRMLTSTSEGLPLHRLCEQAFSGVQSLNAEVNENVRNMESRLHMMEVLTQEVKSSDIQHLFEAPRSLVREALMDMKCHSALRPDWRIRRQYKWYIFSDYLLVCRPDMISSTWHKKELWPLSDVRVSTSNRQWLSSSDGSIDGLAEVSTSLAPKRSSDDDLSRASRATRGQPSDAASCSGSINTPRGRPTPVSVGSRPDGVDTQRSFEPSEHDDIKGGKEGEKPEVMRIAVGKTTYKCWAASEREMLEVISTITSLRRALRQRQEELEKRRAGSTF